MQIKIKLVSLTNAKNKKSSKSNTDNMNLNQNLHSMTKLTEFARDFEEEPETLFGRFVNKIQNAYNQSYNTVNDLSSVNPPQSPTSSTTSNTAKSVFYSDANLQADNSSITRGSSSSSINSNPLYQTKMNSGGKTSPNAADDSSSVEKVDALPIEVHEGRTMVNVLKRMRTMMASKNNVRLFLMQHVFNKTFVCMYI